jgi:glycosyltransferase involved in cell wall biosynthesis
MVIVGSTQKRGKISAFIITKNESKKIERCLSYLHWVDEIVVVDSGSDDGTPDLVKRYAQKHKLPLRFLTKKFTGFAEQKNFAISKCKYSWILDVDADEVVTVDLRDEITSVLKDISSSSYVAYSLPRKEFFLNRFLFMVPLVRFYQKDKATYVGRVHELLSVSGSVGSLSHVLIHENYLGTQNQFALYLRRANLYTALDAEKLIEEGKYYSNLSILLRMIVNPLKYFFGLLLYKKLILRGYPGFLWSFLSGYTEFLVMAKYYELRSKKH